MNKIIVVIGGMGLIGAEIVKYLKSMNIIVIICDIINCPDDDYIILNICDENNINNAINSIYKKYSKIDGVINCAYPRNKNYGQKLENVSYQDFCENTNMHLGGFFLVCKCFSEFFLTQKFGNIINVSSIYATKTPNFEIYANTNLTMPIEYAVIKSGINNMTRYFTNYYKGKNIRFNTISPGGIYNGQPKCFVDAYNNKCVSKGMLNATDICGTVMFLISDSSKYINGQNIIIDDGFSLS